MKIIFEGGDNTGKTTVCSHIKDLFPNDNVMDRDIPLISQHMQLFNDVKSIRNIVSNNIKDKLKDDIVFVLYDSSGEVLESRKEEIVDEYDVHFRKYNKLYQDVFDFSLPNVFTIDISKYKFFSLIEKVVKEIVSYRYEADMSEPMLEGESKKFYKIPDTNLALVELKPTMYSFTHNRYTQDLEGIDDIRVDFWAVFGKIINDYSLIKGLSSLMSNYLGKYSHNDNKYVLVKFFEDIPNIEIIWKNYLVGTMKHNLLDIEKFNGRDGVPLKYDGYLPAPIVRFDWRNPFEDKNGERSKDECIPEDFARFYIDTDNARRTCKSASGLINEVLNMKGYELIDLCYFMDFNGDTICAEITPDGMRIKKSDVSFDKDLWRKGKSKEVIIEKWTELYNDIKNINISDVLRIK